MNPQNTFTLDGVQYIAVAEGPLRINELGPTLCTGCAFDNDDDLGNCARALPCTRGGRPDGKGVIWVRADAPTKETP